MKHKKPLLKDGIWLKFVELMDVGSIDKQRYLRGKYVVHKQRILSSAMMDGWLSFLIVTIHHETSVKSPLGHFQFMLYLESTCPKL